MGEAQRAAGHLEDARFAYENALALDGRESSARLGLGWTFLGLRRPDLAAQAWRPLAGAIAEAAVVREMVRLYRSLGDSAAVRAALGAAATRARP